VARRRFRAVRYATCHYPYHYHADCTVLPAPWEARVSGGNQGPFHERNDCCLATAALIILNGKIPIIPFRSTNRAAGNSDYSGGGKEKACV
jgi:hypothetical protein